MFTKSRLVVVGLLIALAIAPATQTASAAEPDTLITAGTTRYAAVGASAYVYTTSQSWVDLPGMTTNIAIPAGKVGDVFIFFCGETTTDQYAGLRAVIGTWVSDPVGLLASSTVEARCFNFFRLGVPAGTWNVRMRWRLLYLAGVEGMYDRSMIVMVNMR